MNRNLSRRKQKASQGSIGKPLKMAKLKSNMRTLEASLTVDGLAERS